MTPQTGCMGETSKWTPPCATNKSPLKHIISWFTSWIFPQWLQLPSRNQPHFSPCIPANPTVEVLAQLLQFFQNKTSLQALAEHAREVAENDHVIAQVTGSWCCWGCVEKGHEPSDIDNLHDYVVLIFIFPPTFFCRRCTPWLVIFQLRWSRKPPRWWGFVMRIAVLDIQDWKNKYIISPSKTSY